MNNEEVQIIKIGQILGSINGGLPTLMVDENTDISKYYVDILRENVKDTYIIMRTTGIITQPSFSNYNTFAGITKNPLVGISDGPPIIGQSYTINNSSWHTSSVIDIIDGNLLVTKNSVYLIYNKSEERDKKLNILGI